MNEQSRNYINDVIVIINKEIGIDKITSIILFGSQREIENTISSLAIWRDYAFNLWVFSEPIVLLTNKKRRAIHDFIAGTMVIVIPTRERA